MQTGTLTVSVLVTTRGAQLAQESAGRVGIGAGVTTEELCVATGITDSEVMVSQGVLLATGVEEMTGVEETLAEEETWTTGMEEAEDCTMATEEDEEGVCTGVTTG